MAEYALAIVDEVLVQTQSRRAPTHQACERPFARLQRLGPQVLAIQLKEVEGVEEDTACAAAARTPQARSHRRGPPRHRSGKSKS